MINVNDYKREMNDICEKKKEKHIIPICVDFDGTCVVHKYPFVGKTNGNVVEILKRWIKEYNVGIILDTMRGDDTIDAAIKWFNDNEIPLYGIGKHPTQNTWTTSNKAYAPFSIDDRNVGVPLIQEDYERPRVDWDKIVEIFEPILKKLNNNG